MKVVLVREGPKGRRGNLGVLGKAIDDRFPFIATGLLRRFRFSQRRVSENNSGLGLANLRPKFRARKVANNFRVQLPTI